MNNPFTLDFGKKPAQYISRISQTSEIITAFTGEESRHVYLITGVRGSGKTVMLTSITEKIADDDAWYVVELNPSRSLLDSLASKIYSFPEMKKLFIKAKLDFSAFGLGVSIEEGIEITDVEVMLEKMLDELNRHGKKLLIAIDEVESNKEVKVFAHTFQMLLRRKLPVFLIMTGLYDNIYELQNQKSLTFLYRAPKIILEPLNISAIARSYETILKVNREKSFEMARLTRGYSFAYQVLGYLYWDSSSDDINEILPKYDQYLEEFVYEKIWSEMSQLDKEIMAMLSQMGEHIRIKDLRAKLKMDSSLFSVYRERLLRKGVIDTSDYGYVSIALPRFGDFIMNQRELEMM